MKKKWYRSRTVKGILLTLAHASAMAAGAAAAALLVFASMGIRPFGNEDAYLESDTFADSLYNASVEILHYISDSMFLPKDVDSDAVIDLGEIRYDEELSYTNTSGLAYSVQDLEKWAAEGWDPTEEYPPSSPIVICVTPDDKYAYFYYKDFKDQLESGELSIKVSESDLYDYYMTEAEVLSDIDELLRYGTLQEDSYPLEGITDKYGNLKYTTVYSYSGEYYPEEYSPAGAESLLEVLNTFPDWNGAIDEAFHALGEALQRTQSYASSFDALSGYEEGSTNLVYFFADPDNRRVLTNRREYEGYENFDSTLEKISAQPGHVILYPDFSQCETNLESLTDSSRSLGRAQMLENWHFLAGTMLSQDNYVFAVYVKETLEVPDSFANQASFYDKFAPMAGPLSAVLAVSVLVLLVSLVWLTVTAGRKSGDEEVHLCFLDRWFTEISAILVAGVWFLGAYLLLTLIESSADAVMHNITNGNFSYFVTDMRLLVILAALLGLYTVFLFLVGWLSLVRRIKARTLWKNSLLRKALHLLKGSAGILGRLGKAAAGWLGRLGKGALRKLQALAELYSKNTAGRITVTVLLLVIFFLQFLLTTYGYYDGFYLFFLVLLDLAILACAFGCASGRDRIMEGLKRISGGDLQYKIPTKGLFPGQKVMAEYINNIGSGLDAAVESSLKNERMKTELITNVSHDIKTPLTSIINYIGLLQRENFTDPKICGYLDVLEEKAHRLKILTEDVVEASKASTGNITLEMAELDFVEMVHQVIGEFEERFREHGLTMMVHFADEPSVIYADGQRMWRVLENIFNNVTKYAMEGTRVYAEVKNADKKVIFSLKNISAQPLNFDADELTERFVRGDVSRNTEGSGLGLSIAKSLTELQGGEFKLYLDGDLFKVTITFAQKTKGADTGI